MRTGFSQLPALKGRGINTEWYTPAQAMRILGMSKSTFWRRIHEGTLVARQDGPRTYRVSGEALRAYLEENRTFDPAA